MAKFCTKCGKKLEDGKPCDCCKKEVKKEVVVESKTNGFDFNECVNSYIEMVKGIFVKPIDTIKTVSYTHLHTKYFGNKATNN